MDEKKIKIQARKYILRKKEEEIKATQMLV